jgi:YbgC/YbaW family acyl-CoA thioester hydrolase
MARVKIHLPDRKIASFSIPLRISDINYGNHLGNDSMVSMVHEARIKWLMTLGYTELDVEGVGLIMSDLCVEYKNEAFYPDELKIDMYMGDMARVSFDLYFSITNLQNKLIAKAKTGMVCFDYSQRSVVHIPEKFRSIMGVSSTFDLD